MKQRILTALLIIAVMFPCLYFGGVLLNILVVCLAAIASTEILRLFHKEKNYILAFVILLMTMLVYYLDESYTIAICAAYLVVLFVFVLLDEQLEVGQVSTIFLISFLLAMAIRSILNVYTDYGNMAMMFILLATYGCDTGAYFFGVFFGKHKLIERISPKKTWEGAIGGWITGAVLSLVFATLVPFGLEKIEMMLLATALPLVGQIGDLAFSAIKRHYQVKDYGNLFPGHGGVLDRIDSLIFCLMIFNVIVTIW